MNLSTSTRFILLLLLSSPLLPAKLLSYSFPPEFPASSAYQATIDGTAVPALQTKRGAFLSFGMTAPVEIRVRVGQAPKEVVIRPLSSGITARRNGRTIAFTLARPMNLSVELDGNLDDPLFIFANPEIEAPDRNDPKVKFYEGGKIHDVGEINLSDGETLYLEGGAVVRAVVRARGKNVAVRGPGILDAGTRTHKINMLVLRECRQAVLEHFIILDPLGWTIHLSGSQDVTVSNTRVIGWRANSDGLDIEYSKKIRVDACFWRTNDDCIAVKALYPPGVQDVPFEEMINPETLGKHQVPRRPGDVVGDILITNCVLWNDSGGQGFEVGFELRVDTIRGITFRNCDIIHIRGGGAFTIHNGDRAKIEDIHIEDVRIENTDRLIDFHVGLSIYSDDCPEPYRRSNPKRQAPPNRPKRANNPWQWFVPADEDLPKYEANRGLVRNVTIRNVQVLTPPRKGSMLNGFSPRNGISDITIENLVIAGKTITSAEEADIHLMHVRNLRFLTDATKAKP